MKFTPILLSLIAMALLAIPAQADGGQCDTIVNIQTNDIVFLGNNGATDTLALSVEEDLTTGQMLSGTVAFIQGPLVGLDLTVGGSGSLFSITGPGILMNFGLFDYSLDEAYPFVIGFPNPGTYGYELFYNDEQMGSTHLTDWPESGEVTVTEVPNVPEPSFLSMLCVGLFVLSALKLKLA
jgi:hypothetical protein